MIIDDEIRFARCQLCNADEAAFQKVEFTNDWVYFWFNCSGCGERWYFYAGKSFLQKGLIAFLECEALRGIQDLKTYLVKLFIFSGNNQQFIHNLDGYHDFCKEASKKMAPKSWWREIL